MGQTNVQIKVAAQTRDRLEINIWLSEKISKLLARVVLLANPLIINWCSILAAKTLIVNPLKASQVMYGMTYFDL